MVLAVPGAAVLAARLREPYSLARILSSFSRLEGLVYSEVGRSYWMSYTTRFEWSGLPAIAREGVVMVAVSDWTCVYGLRIVGGHALAWVMVCAARVPPQTRFTISLPDTLRKVHRAWLMGYAWRLLDEGSSTERIAARLVKLGARAAMVALVSEAPRRTPVAIMAGERLCIGYEGGIAFASTTSIDGRCTLVDEKVVTLKLQAGVARLEVRKLEDVAR